MARIEAVELMTPTQVDKLMLGAEILRMAEPCEQCGEFHFTFTQSGILLDAFAISEEFNLDLTHGLS